MTDAGVITLGGRRFVKLTTGATVEHDYWFMAHISRAGLREVRMLEGESTEAFTGRILEMALMSGLVLEMLGALLLPEGKGPTDWTPELGEETARFLGALTDDESKATLSVLVVSLLMDFFVTGLLSVLPTRKSSSGEEPAPVAPA